MFFVIKVLFVMFYSVVMIISPEVAAQEFLQNMQNKCDLLTIPNPLVTNPNTDILDQAVSFIIHVDDKSSKYDISIRNGIGGDPFGGPRAWFTNGLVPNSSGNIAWLNVKPDASNIWKAGQPHSIYVRREGASGEYCPGLNYKIVKFEDVTPITCNILGPKETNEDTEISLSGTITPPGTYRFFVSSSNAAGANKSTDKFTIDSGGSIPKQNLGKLNSSGSPYQVTLQKDIPQYLPVQDNFTPVDSWIDVPACHINPIVVQTDSNKPNPNTTPTNIGSGTGTNPTSGNKPPPQVCKPGECTTGGGLPCGTDPAIATAIGCIHTSVAGFTNDILKFVVGISGGLAFLMMLLGAFQMLTSAGNPDTLNAGRERLTSAIIGLLLVIFAVLLLQIIGVDILKLPKFEKS